MMKVALYARYSSEHQRDASIEDQLRICRLRAEGQGWFVVGVYTDRAISGASLLRPGIQKLLQDAQRGNFQVVLAEALDRLSRDQEDIAGLFKRLTFAGARIVTLSEGDVGHLHIGLKGTMNALFLKDLADKTRRGQQGRIEAGKSGGGLCYGYDPVKAIGADGEPVRGERRVNSTEAAIIRRIFREYAAGRSSRTIAIALNKDKMPGPQSRAWGPSTIHGSVQRRNGILNNELYVGRLVWNRQHFLKDPETGKRIARPNPETEWITHPVPELRIVDDVLWEAVRDRQDGLKIKTGENSVNPMAERRRPKFLFAKLARCGRCGGGYNLISGTLLGCATARNKGTCDNRLNIRRDSLEASVLVGLRDQLMEPALFKEFCEEFAREVNRLRMEESASLEAQRGELPKIGRQIHALIEAIKDGLYQPTMRAEMEKLEARKADIEQALSGAQAPPPLLHPSLAEVYRQKIASLAESLARDDLREAAAEIIRTLVSAIVLTPEEGKLTITLQGDLAAMLSYAAASKKPGAPGGEARLFAAIGSQSTLVAGARYHLDLLLTG